MSLMFVQNYGRVGGLYPTRDPILVGGKAEYENIMDFGLDFETFIKNTTISLQDISDIELDKVGITREISKSYYCTKTWLTLKVGGAELKMYISLEKDSDTVSEVTASQDKVKSSLFCGAITYSDSVFSFKNCSDIINKKATERLCTFSTQTSTYSSGKKTIVGSYVSACAPHPKSKVVLSEEEGDHGYEEGGYSYVIKPKNPDEKPILKDNVYYDPDGSEWTQPTFCNTTHPDGFDGALDDAKTKVYSFEEEWHNALIKLGISPQDRPYTKSKGIDNNN